MKAVIIAGGLGTRLQPYTTFIPKPMLPLGEKPLLEHMIEWLIRNKITDIILCVSYLRRVIMDYFEDGSRFGADIRYVEAQRPLATAGQLGTARNMVDGTFVCLYGDSLFDFDLQDMISGHKSNGPMVTIGTHPYKTRIRYGVIRSDENGRVVGWDEKPEISADINTGCYIMEPDIFEYIPRDVPSGMDAVIRDAISDGRQINTFSVGSTFIDIGDQRSYQSANQKFIDKLGEI